MNDIIFKTCVNKKYIYKYEESPKKESQIFLWVKLELMKCCKRYKHKLHKWGKLEVEKTVEYRQVGDLWSESWQLAKSEGPPAIKPKRREDPKIK